MSNNATIFPLQGHAYMVPVVFRDISGNLITGVTGATSLIVIDGAAAQGGPTPIESGSSGQCLLAIPANQMTGQIIQVVCYCTNANMTNYCCAIYTYPAWSTGSGGANPNTTRPTDPIGKLMWMFAWLYNLSIFNRSPGLQTVYDDQGNQLTTRQNVGNEVQFTSYQGTP